MAPTVPRSAAIYDDVSTLAAQRGYARSRHWAYVVDNGLMYRWVADDTTATNGLTVIGHTGGDAGRWHAIFGDTAASAALGNADATLSIGSGTIFTMPASTLSDDRTLTLSPTGVPVGAVVTIVRNDLSIYTIAVVNGGAGGGTIFTFPAGNTGSADFRFDGTNFSRLRICIDP